MKKRLIDNYVLVFAILFLIYNIVFKNIIIDGLLYKIFIVILLISNYIILFKYNKRMRYKEMVLLFYFFTWFFISKDILQCLLGISNVFILIAISFKKNIFINIFLIFILVLFIILLFPLLNYYILSLLLSENIIYQSTIYQCDNNYIIYSYSYGAIDRVHYRLTKNYNIIDIDDIITITYYEKKEISQNEYDKYLSTYKCRKNGDIDEYR